VLYLRSAVFNAIMVLSVLIYAPLSLLTFPLPALVRYRFITQWSRFHIWLAWRLCGLRYRVEGKEHLPSGPAIILSKHQSAWETLAFQIIFPPHTWVLKRELIWLPLFGWALALLRPIAIERGAARRAFDQVIRQGRKRLAAGLWVLVFTAHARQVQARRCHACGGYGLPGGTGRAQCRHILAAAGFSQVPRGNPGRHRAADRK
jgi:1-acyl-sn-glycerol-3-phosphate acyltransferase